MLAPVSTPQSLNDLHQANQNLGKQMGEVLLPLGREESVPTGTNLLNPRLGDYVFLESGFFKLCESGRIVRFYDNFEILETDAFRADAGFEITSDFGARLVIFERVRLLEALRENLQLFTMWCEYQRNELLILEGLCLIYTKEEPSRPNLKIRQFNSGDVIAMEGSEADQVFVMLEGQARVLSQGVEVGTIRTGEVFGEIAFFAEKRRSATVVANDVCLVQAVERAEFERLVRSNPNLVLDITRTLARRVMDLNVRLVGGAGL